MTRILRPLLIGILLCASSGAAFAENDGPVATQRGPTSGRGVALLSAVVDADGTINRGSGVTEVQKPGTGNYVVIFSRNVRECTYVATIGLSGAVGTSADATIDVVGAAVDVKGVFVDTEEPAGTQVDRGFHLIVFCDE